MLTFFRANTYFHIFSILVILLLLKLPFLLDVLPVINTELEWMLVGERLNNSHNLYGEIWSHTGPLAAYIYGFVHFLFGRNQFYYELAALFLVYFQALYFTFLINRNKVFIERNYLPGLVYILIMSLSFDLNKLSPTLMATTFLLFALNGFFKHIDHKEGNSAAIFEMGLALGIGSLFLYSFPIFVFWGMLSLIMFTNIKFNQILLLLLSFSVPLLLASLFFYFQGSIFEFYQQWMSHGFSFRLIKATELKDLFLVYGLVIMVAIFGVFKVLKNPRYTNFQNRKHQSLILSSLFAILVYILSDESASYHLICMSPFLAFFVSGWFHNLKGTVIPEILFLGFMGLLLLVNAQGISNFGHLNSMRIQKKSEKTYIQGQSILITGNRNDDYFHAKSGSPYVNWEVSKHELESANYFESIIAIQAKFAKELPTFILDYEQVFPSVFERIPDLSQKYMKIEGTRHYRLRSAYIE